MVVVGQRPEADARIDRVRRRIRDVGGEEQRRPPLRLDLARQRRDERRRVAAAAAARPACRPGRCARSPSPASDQPANAAMPSSSQIRYSPLREHAPARCARTCAGVSGIPASAMNATSASSSQSASASSAMRMRARRRRARRATSVSTCWRRCARSTHARAGASRQRRANDSQAASAPMTPCSAGCSAARSSANAAAGAASARFDEQRVSRRAGPPRVDAVAAPRREIEALVVRGRRALHAECARRSSDAAAGFARRTSARRRRGRRRDRCGGRGTWIGASAVLPARGECYDSDTPAHRLLPRRRRAMVSTATPAGELGMIAPAFDLPGIDGQRHTLASVRGDNGTRRDVHLQSLSVRQGGDRQDRARHERARRARRRQHRDHEQRSRPTIPRIRSTT